MWICFSQKWFWETEGTFFSKSQSSNARGNVEKFFLGLNLASGLEDRNLFFFFHHFIELEFGTLGLDDEVLGFLNFCRFQRSKKKKTPKKRSFSRREISNIFAHVWTCPKFPTSYIYIYAMYKIILQKKRTLATIKIEALLFKTRPSGLPHDLFFTKSHHFPHLFVIFHCYWWSFFIVITLFIVITRRHRSRKNIEIETKLQAANASLLLNYNNSLHVCKLTATQ